MEEWERLERRWKIVWQAVGMLIGAAVMFLLLLFAARHSGMKAQDQFSLLCERMAEEARRRDER